MSRVYPVFAVAVVAAGVVGTFAVPRSDSAPPAAVRAESPTVGDFVLRYAAAQGLAGQTASPEEARAALRKAGVIGSGSLDLSAPLTEGDVSSLSSRQLKVTTNAPERAFSQQRLTEFFDVFGPELRQIARRRDEAAMSKSGLPLQPAALIGDDFVPGKGAKGKGKGKGPSPHQP